MPQMVQTLLERFRQIPVPRFNRGCGVIAFLWLAVSVPTGILLRPTVSDFSQFYIGGVIARHGDWDSLYPVPARRSLDNAGLRTHSWAKPGWRSFSAQFRAPDYTHFILPPPSALVFIPLSYLTYRQAFWSWIALSALCIFGVAFYSALLLRHVLTYPSRWEGGLMLLVVLSPVSARAIRIANVSAPIAFLFGVLLVAVIRNQPLRGAAALALGGLLKYATWVVAPVLLATRHFRMLAWVTAFGLTSLLVTLGLAGTAPFSEFMNVIVPTLSRPSSFQGNQSMAGYLARTYGRPLPLGVATMLDLARVATLGGIALVLVGVRVSQWRQAVTILAAAALLMSWLLIFSPIAWEHWPVLLCPLWGWLLWEYRQAGMMSGFAPMALVLLYFPAGIFQVQGIGSLPIRLPEPFNSFQLAGILFFWLLAFARMVQIRRAPETDLGKPATVQIVG